MANRKQRAAADAPSTEDAARTEQTSTEEDPTTRALAIVPPTKRTITRAQANEILKASAIEKFHEAKRKQEASRTEFEAAFGRTDRIDDGLLRDLQALQMRFAAINARQHASSSSHYGEPKVSRFVSQLGTMIGDISAHLATDRALQLFEQVRESDYIGYNGNTVGPRGLDEAALAEYEIVEDVRVTKDAETDAAPYDEADDDDAPCLHQTLIEIDENEKECAHCGESFTIAAQAS